MLRIKQILKKKGMTANDLAGRMGVSHTAVSLIVNGNPTVSTLEKIATALEVNISDLFETPPAPQPFTLNNLTFSINGTTYKAASPINVLPIPEEKEADTDDNRD